MRDEKRVNAEVCRRCGSENPSWSASSPLWNAVMRGGSINGASTWGDMVCATCFMVLAEEAGIASLFRVTADVVNVELETVTPSGRVWNPETFMWEEPDRCQAPLRSGSHYCDLPAGHRGGHRPVSVVEEAESK